MTRYLRYLLIVLLLSSTAQAAETVVPVYQWLRCADPKPDLSVYGIRDDAKFAGHWELFPRDDDGKPDLSGWINEERARHHLKGLAPGTPVFLNIEQSNGGEEWATYKIVNYNPKFRKRGMALRLRLLEWIRKEVNPSLRLGFYQQPGGWGGLILNRPEKWHEYVRQLAPMLQAQDISIPQFYFTKTSGMYGKGLEDALLYSERYFDAMQFYAPSTPVWPVVWPCWYDLWRETPPAQNTVEHRDGCAISGHAWRAILGYCLSRSDGLFIWNQGGAPWDHSAPHWRVTRELIQVEGE